MKVTFSPIGMVRNAIQNITDDNWGSKLSVIELLDPLQEDALNGLEDFSHAEVIFFFDQVDEQDIVTGARHPRNNPDWPKVGILAQRSRNRPNRLGATIVRIMEHTKRTLTVEGLDAMDGTSVIDIKPVMREFLPRSEVRQPNWASELMKDYWANTGNRISRDYQKAAPTEYQRLPEHQRNELWVKLFLRHGQIAHVAHLSGDQPFVTPTNYWFDEQTHQIIIHSNLTGRTRSNLEHYPKVCVEVSEFGRLLPANTALEFGLQYRSVMVFGKVRILENNEERQRGLYGLLTKYFPDLTPGREFRPITDRELARTSVFAVEIESWSGKENWSEQADQLPDWPTLPDEILKRYSRT
jgi:tRNA-Thr(GGU) m(6)t(6)A37 methyltransferase TsaA